MAKYEFNGQVFEAPDEMPEQDVVKAVMADHEAQQKTTTNQVPPPSNGEVPTAEAPPPAPEAPAAPAQGETLEDALGKPVDGKLDPDKLYENPEWMTAAKQLWQERHPAEPWTGSDEELSKKALWTMSMMDNNLTIGALDAARLRNASPREKEAMLHLMEIYEHTSWTWKGLDRAGVAMIGDPVNLVGLGSFGFGTAAAQTGKIASRSALKQMLRTGLKTSLEGAALGAAQDTIRQTTEIEVGKEKEFDSGRLAKSAGLGALIGGGLGAGVEGVAAKVGAMRAAGRKAPELVPEVTPKPAEVVPLRDGEKPAGGAAEAPAEAGTGGKVAPDGSTDLGDINVNETPAEPKPAEVPGAEPVKPGETPAPVPETPATPEATAGDNVVPFKPKDEVPIASPEGAQSVMEAIKAASEESGARVFPATREAVTEASRPATEILAKIKPEEMPEVVEQLRRQAVTTEQQLLLHNTFKTAHEQFLERSSNLYREIAATDDPVQKAILQREFQTVSTVRDNLRAGDLALSSSDGRGLGDRVGAYLTGERRDISVQSIMKDKFGVDIEKASVEQLNQAHAEFFRQYEMWKKVVETNDAVLAIDKQMQEAYESGAQAGYNKLVEDRNALIETLRQQEMESRGVLSGAYRGFNQFLRYNNELIISQVFTTSTVAVNTIPSAIRTIYQPALDAGMKGFDMAARRQLTATYMAMAQSVPTALRAAKAAFDLERSLIGSEANKVLETETVFRGRGGRVLRTFPRMLGATDEFFAQVNYRGFVVGNATSSAVEAGLRLGLKGEALEKFVVKHVDDMATTMFSADVNAANVIPHLRQVALDKGYRGGSVDEWIKTQLDKNADLFRTAYNESGKRYADDLLFKRRFSKENNISKAAALYEKFVNDNPWMKMTGQLFFRTPVRVFEEGIKLTPGLNLLTPRMLADLAGHNGKGAQAKAEGYMFVSYAIGTWAMAQYAQGKLTSGGPTQYKIRRGRENAGDWQPYSIRVGGQNISFRNLDPFGTPLKIIANVMDRYNELEYRKAQGEYVDDKMKETLSWLSVSVGSIASAISDANLTDGLAELMKLGEATVDPEKHDQTFSRFLLSKAKLYVPNQLNKVMQQFDHTMADPVTLQQTMLARINPGSALVPRQYDVLGNPRSHAAPLGMLLGVQFASNDQLKRGKDDKELAVLKAVNDLEIAAGEGFGVFPTKAPKEYGMQGMDLREVYTKDGKTTYYDRLNQLYKGLGVKEQLYAALVDNKEGSVGTKGQDGIRTQLAKGIIKEARNVAFVILMSEESGLQASQLKAIQEQNDILSGKRDNPSLPYR